jgi:hypothetical protein
VKLGESAIDIVDEVLVWGILGLVIVFLLGIALPAFLRFFLFPEKPDEESGLKKHGFPTMSKLNSKDDEEPNQ